jgi:predicted deacetylase
MQKTYLINISIDDVSPHPRSSTKVLDRCYELITIFPDIKFTLFIPTCYTRQGERSYNILNFPIFIDTIKKLPKENFEVGYHGHYHGILNQNSNNEFMFNSYQEANDRIKIMKEIMAICGIAVSPIFRPPAWRITPQAMRALLDNGIITLSLSNDNYAQQEYKEFDKHCPKVIYYNCCPPFKQLQLYQTTEIVYHACEWDRSYLSKEKTQELVMFLNNINEFKFVFLESLWENQTV